MSVDAAGMPFAQRRELLARPDAAATVDRLTGALNGTERPELHVELVALAVLRARQAAERQRTNGAAGFAAGIGPSGVVGMPLGSSPRSSAADEGAVSQ